MVRCSERDVAQSNYFCGVATHFSSAVGTERRFGTELLKHLAARKKGRAGDEARVVLRAVSG